MTRYNTGINSRGRSIVIPLPAAEPGAPPRKNAKLIATFILCSPGTAASAASPGHRPARCRGRSLDKFVSGNYPGRLPQNLEGGFGCGAGKLNFKSSPYFNPENPTAFCFLFDTALPSVSDSGSLLIHWSRSLRPDPKRVPRTIRNGQPLACQGEGASGSPAIRIPKAIEPARCRAYKALTVRLLHLYWIGLLLDGVDSGPGGPVRVPALFRAKTTERPQAESTHDHSQS